MPKELKLNRNWPAASYNSIPLRSSVKLPFEPAEQLVQKRPFLWFFLLGKQKKEQEGEESDEATRKRNSLIEQQNTTSNNINKP